MDSINLLGVERPRAESRLGRSYGWKHDTTYTEAPKKTFAVTATPSQSQLDLRSRCPPIFDQGQLGSCTSHGSLGAFQFLMMNGDLSKNVNLSRLWLYYQERVLEGTVADDAGAQIYSGVRVLQTLGCPQESLWPYDIELYSTRPSKMANRDAKNYLLVKASALHQNLRDLKLSLIQRHPVVFGCLVFPSFEDPSVASTGRVPLPDPSESCLGGHCMMLVGFDDSSQSFLVRNSWGTAWGLGGYCWMPYAYLLNPQLSSDFWSYEQVRCTPGTPWAQELEDKECESESQSCDSEVETDIVEV